jgi:uncharacterized repeat protein (TIGR01451 family)
MLKKLLTAFALLFVALCYSPSLMAQCTTQAGTLSPANYPYCGYDSTFFVDQFTLPTLDANDTWQLVVHTGTATTLGTIVGTSWFVSNQGANITMIQVPPGVYQISMIAGDRIPGTTNVDLTDPCLSVAGGATVTVYAVPEITVTVENATIGCGNTDVDLSATVSPAGNYQYQWYGLSILTDPTQPNVTVGAASGYSVLVKNAVTGCFSYGYGEVQGSNPFFAQIVETQMDCEQGGTSMLRCTTEIGNFTYLWSTGATTQEISVLTTTPTTYTVTATRASDNCQVIRTLEVQPNLPLSVSLFYSPPFNCQSPFAGIYASVNPFVGGVVNPITYQWSTGATTSVLQNPVSGTYSITVTHTVWNCTAEATIVVEQSSLECGTLTGFVYSDLDENCAQSSGDYGLQNILIKATNTTTGIAYYALTAPSGDWTMGLEPGQYTVEMDNPNALWVPCVTSYNITVTGNNIQTLDFFLKHLYNCPLLSVDIATPALVRCFSGLYHVNYSNMGVAVAEDAYIDVTLDPDLTLSTTGGGLAASAVSLGNNTWRFPLGDVPPNTFRYNYFYVQVGCDGVELGEAHCTEAQIFPQGTCGDTSALWSGAHLELSATCQNDSLKFKVTNTGSSAMTQALEYVVIEDAVMLLSAPPPTFILGAGEAVDINVPANGATWRMEVTQEPNHPGLSMPSLTVEGCTTGSQFSLGFVNQFSFDDANPYIDIDCTENVGSYDPNDKQGFPIGYGQERFIEQNTDIEYLIRFQNTGTAPAFTVVIRDTLSAFLDPKTFVPGASSHPYTVDFYGNGPNVRFTFDNINLPDSASNFEASQGFVSFRISQQPDVALGSTIENSAAIYFDFNEPIITNTTKHLIGKDFVAVSAWEPINKNLSLGVSPNPMGDQAILTVRGLESGTNCRMELIDQWGRTVTTHKTQDASWRIQRGQLASGAYTLRVLTDNGLVGVSKLVIK